MQVEDVRVEGANAGSRFKIGLRHTGTFLGVPATGKWTSCS